MRAGNCGARMLKSVESPKSSRSRPSPAAVLLVLVGWCLWPATAIRAEETAAASARSRIGLVLSGGGARGAAHIGVLKVLDELRIPIEAVAGTSMGALVGGLYASGMSASEVESLVTSLDWQDAFRDRPPRTALGFRRKQDDRNFLVRYSLGVSREGFRLPMGLVQGQKQTQILRGATLQVADIEDFDRLPIPFRAVATDLESGAPVVMQFGDVVTAMRASMSAPGVFTPVERDGRLLVDGGLSNNLPVDIAREMNVDVLVVVDVSFPLYARDELDSPISVTNQSVAIMVRNRTLERLETLSDEDVLISPQLGTMGSAEFNRVPQALRAGEQAGRAAAEKLAAYSLSESAYRRYLAERSARESDLPRIDFVRTDAASARYARVVDAMVGDLRGKTLNRARVNDDVAALYALDLFESIDYKVVQQGDQSGLEFQLRRKSWGPNYVRVGLSLEDDFAGNSRYNAAARLIMTELNSWGGEWLTDVQIGDRPRFATEFYQPLSAAQRYFVSPHFEFNIRNLQFLNEDDAPIAEYRVRNISGGVDLGRELANWGEIRVGVERGSGSSRLLIGDPTLPTERYDTGGFFAKFSYDTLDNVFFPHRGQQFTLQWNSERSDFGSDQKSDKIAAQWLNAHSFGRYTLIASADLGTFTHNDVAPHDYFTLGGFLNLSGYTADSLTGPHYGIGRLIYYRQIGRGGTGVLELPAYAGISLEAGNTWADRDDARFSSLRHSGSLFFGADTPLGPVYLAAGVGDRGKTAFYLFLGRTF